MKPTNLTIKDLWADDARLTFLVGAGCSINAPSCLPAGRPMMEAIVKYTCAESEVKKILGLKELRFEQLVEVVRDRLDTELKIIDYYGQCDKPNIQHFFLAEMIKKGHFVMTTNFDFLIEHALLQSGVPEKEILPVITREDFENYNDPQELYKKGKKTLYKIHGSTKNIITNVSTKDSLVATIQAFGSNKEGLNVFQIEPFKHSLFDNISRKRTLMVMGYSGSDDFDIVPTLKILKDIHAFIWINHDSDDSSDELIYEIEETLTNNVDNVNQILVDIKRIHKKTRVYRVDVNTSRIIKNLFHADIKVDSQNFDVQPLEWLKNNLEAPNEFIKYNIPSEIYSLMNLPKDALRCAKKILSIAKNENNPKWMGVAFTNIGGRLFNKGELDEALNNYQEAIKIHEKLGELRGKGINLNNIGFILNKKGKIDEALRNYKEALDIADQLNDFKAKAIRLTNIGEILYEKGELDNALKNIQEALKINEQLGNLYGKADDLNNIGRILHDKGELDKALKNFEDALEISKQLSNMEGQATMLNNIGSILIDKGELDQSMIYYRKALKICNKLGKIEAKSVYLNNIGIVLTKKGKFSEAIKYFEETLEIDKQLGNLENVAKDLNKIAFCFKEMGELDETLKYYKKSLEINEKSGNMKKKAKNLTKIGDILSNMDELDEALKYYLDAFNIFKKNKDLQEVANIMMKIAINYFSLNYYKEALELFEQILEFYEDSGDISEKALCLWWIGTIYAKMNKKIEAISNFQEALKIYKTLGLKEKIKSV